MGYRVLVDENTSPRVAELLCENGHTATHITTALDVGVTDEEIVGYAAERDLLVVTHDDDFLLPEYADRVRVCYYADDTLSSADIADRVDELSQYVPTQSDLPPITNLGSWDH